MAAQTLDIADVRRRYSSLDRGFAFFDAPGGTQVPDEVGEAMARAMREASANLGAPYATSHRVQEALERAEAGSARFLGCDPSEVMFGANMTSLNFMLTRTASRDWVPGDEILSSNLDHEGNVAPWLEVARDRGLVVRQIELRDDTTLDLDDLERKLSARTRVVSCAWASNAVGTIVDARRVCELAHSVGALAWIDAVQYAAHEAIDVEAIGADVLLCSAYKWSGPHIGIAYVRRSAGESWRPYKVRPAPSEPFARRFSTGTFPFELFAGLNATYDYIDAVGGLAAMHPYERELGERFVAELPAGVRLHGLPTLDGRVPTFLITLDGRDSAEVSQQLADRGYGVWAADHWYSLGLRATLDYETTALRVGIAHYNSHAELDGLLAALGELVG